MYRYLVFLSIHDRFKLRESKYWFTDYENLLEFKNPLPLRLKEARNKARISQMELGVRIGLEASSASGRMNHYEKGRHTPDLQTLSRIAFQLDVPLNYFFCETEESAEINVLLHRLSKDERNLLLAWIKSKDYLNEKL